MIAKCPIHSVRTMYATKERKPESLVDTSCVRDFVELHEQVQSSVNLLDSLESFLSTFQDDLSEVSGQISNLQARSKDIEGRLKGRRVSSSLPVFASHLH